MLFQIYDARKMNLLRLLFPDISFRKTCCGDIWIYAYDLCYNKAGCKYILKGFCA